MDQQMESTEMNPAGPEGSQKDEMLPPSEENTPPVLTDTSAPLNFSVVTPRRFGISVQSFTPAASSNHKDKSRLSQLKARRRSGIGVRGSPETNSLIRFMAQQRLKTPTNYQTPEPVSHSPLLPRVASTLRQKMASFQSLMDVEEREVCDPMPRQDGNTGGCIKTRDYLSDGNGKENHPPLMMPSAKKRRCLAPLESCEVEIREASAPVPQFKLKEQEEDEETVTQVLKRGPSTSSETVKEVQPELISPPLPPATCSTTNIQQDGFFELQSLSRPLAAVSPFHFPSLPGLLEMKPTGDDDSTGTSAVKKKKRVRFGVPLSPEFFDKHLPPSTPLLKGGTPLRAPTPGGALQLRSLLKTPQKSEPQTPQAPSDFYSTTDFGASPTLAMPRNFKRQSVEEDSEEDGKIVFPSMEEIDSAVTSDTGYLWDSQPLNLNSAFHEESLSQIVTESETKPSSTSQMLVLDEPVSSPEKKKPATPAAVKSKRRRKKQRDAEFESTSEAPARSGSRKRKQPEESEPVKRSTRSAAKTASGKMKTTSAAARRWNRDVDRSLYGSREYASKNPNLSPITERLSFITQSLAAQQAPSASCTKHAAPTPETPLNLDTAHSMEATGELTVTHDWGNPSEDSGKSPNPSKESCVREGRRLVGQKSRGRGTKQRKVSVADCNLLCEETGGLTEEHCEDQTTSNPEASRETPLCHTAPYQREEDIELEAKTPADIPSTNSEGKSECPASLNALLPSDEELNDLSAPAEFSKRKAEGRSSSVNSSVDQEQGDQVQEHQTSHEVEDNQRGDQAENLHENCRSSSDSQEEERPLNLDLAPWQADFNFEDVFKSVATRGQRSVRRSLRNQSNVAQSNGAGLAWMPRTSPDSSKEARRRTRGRRLSTALPAQPSVSEETQDNSS
ncbi:cell division cycle-associated protein 2 isoform X2 [Hippoglossus hippoglossus]|uniref:cell division cycle-associated protein 2 isoform X2 n=1 Tax=Hippoglossus hippoglossus TaxID=8267 RepID=UPI00148BB522|nr:cell division cycle-associated protein 2 isoform X2 [Hippoglossus hippoglossus]